MKKIHKNSEKTETSSKKRSYSKLISLMSVLMQTSGLWSSSKNRSTNRSVVVLIFVVYLFLVCGVIASFFDNETITDTIDSSVIVVLIMLDLGQYVALIAKKEHLTSLIEYVEQVSQVTATDDDEYGTVTRAHGEFWSLFVTATNIVGVAMTLGAYLFKTKFYRLQDRNLLFPLKLPISHHHALVFAPLLLIQVLGGFISCQFRLFASAMINGPLFMLISEFRILRRDFERQPFGGKRRMPEVDDFGGKLRKEVADFGGKQQMEFDDYRGGERQVAISAFGGKQPDFSGKKRMEWFDNGGKKQKTNPDYHRDLKQLVIRHNKLVSLCKNIEKVMSVLILILYIICEVLLCLQSFKLYKDWSRLKAEDVATGMTMLLQTVQHLFFYFYAAQNLMSQTQDLHASIYCSSWYKTDPKYQKLLSIVLSRSVRPVILTAGKVLPVTFRSFLKGLQAAFSYFNLLRALTHS